MEAITLGIKHIAVSDISVLREIYDRGVYFFDPTNAADFDVEKLDRSEISDEDLQHYREKYSWEKSAKIIYQEIMKNEK